MRLRQRVLTLSEFLRLPETEPASEYVDGRIIRKVSPKGKHSRLEFRCAERLNQAAEPERRGVAFPELRCTFAGRSLVHDVAFFTWSRIPRDPSGEVGDEFFLPPDLAIEIVSPRQSAGRLEEKLSFCVQNGVRLGWLAHPKAKHIVVFRPERPPEKLTAGVLDAAPVLPGVAFSVEEVFGWLILPR